MKKNPVVWFEIYVSDMKRAKDFYENVFQTKLEKIGADHADLEMWAFPGSIGQYGHNSLVYDSEGNMFGLHSMK